jgi:Protein of unknown function (DUF4199)
VKIALKYGLIITVCFIAWVVTAHWLVPNPQSLVHSAGAGSFVNIVQILSTFFGIRARRQADGGELRFKGGIKTGVGIAVVYGLSMSLFFVIELIVIGPKWLPSEPGAGTKPLWQNALGAFLGLGGFAVLFGLVYSTIISFILAKRSRA